MAWYDFNKTEVVKPTMADLRKAAEAEYSDGSRYGIRPEGYEKYGDMDWFGGRDTRPTWTEEDQLRINQIEAEQQMYNQNNGTTYSGGPLSAPERTYLHGAHRAFENTAVPFFEGTKKFIHNLYNKSPKELDHNGQPIKFLSDDVASGHKADTINSNGNLPQHLRTTPLLGKMPVVDPSDFIRDDQILSTPSASSVQVSPFRGNPYPPGPLSASRISEALNERRKKQANADLITKVNLRF